MDGTILRTALVIATSLNTALMATDLTGFQNEKVDFWYKIASIILNFIIVALATYFNNDYTDEAVIGTDITRRLKDNPDIAIEVTADEDGDDIEEDPEEPEAEPEDGDEIIEPYEGDESGDVE